MTASEFRAALAELDLHQKQFAEMTGVRAETISRWATGAFPVPRSAELTVNLLLRERAVSK